MIVSSPTTLSIDVYTDKGGRGSDKNGGTYTAGTIVTFYFSVNMDVTSAQAIIYFPDGTIGIELDQPLSLGTYYDSGIAGGSMGTRRLVFEAWTADGQHAIDEVDYTVIPIGYSYTITVSGLESYSTGAYLDGQLATTLRDGESHIFNDLSGTHTISIDQVIAISNDNRLYCGNQSITVNAEGSFTFHYNKQYLLTLSVRPDGSGTTSRSSGWYFAGTSLTIVASAASEYSFKSWTGDYTSSSNTIVITLNKPMTIIANFIRQSTISCYISKSTITRLDALTVSGRLTPSPNYAVRLTLTYHTPAGSRQDTVLTDTNGNYRSTISPDLVGSWSVSVSWNGDDNFGPASSQTVSFTVTARTFSITISTNRASDSIIIVVDQRNIKGSALPQIYHWDEFSTHTILIDKPYYNENDFKRYRFDGWSDGSYLQSKTVTVDRDMELTVRFITQYYLTIESQYGNPNGQGWYDEGSIAHAELDKGEVPSEDIFHIYKFTRWSGDATGTSLISDPITMNSPKNVIAIWEKELSLVSYVSITVVILAAIMPVIYVKLYRRKKIETQVISRGAEGEIDEIKREIEKYRNYIDKLESNYKEGKIEKSSYDRLKKDYESKLKDLEEKNKRIIDSTK